MIVDIIFNVIISLNGFIYCLSNCYNKKLWDKISAACKHAAFTCCR